MDGRVCLEIDRTVEYVNEHRAQFVALQFPEGLFQFACTISDIIEQKTGADCVVLSDVAYGACCIADELAQFIGADVLIHYAHRGLVDQRRLCLPVLYVICEFTPTAFVLPELSPEAAHRCPPLAAPNLPPLCRHLGELLTEQFPPETRLAICTTAQHSRMLQDFSRSLLESYFRGVIFPANPPLPPGEILGCTAPHIQDCDAIVCVVDGRFHTEAVIMANPSKPVYRYEPHTGRLTRETMDITALQRARRAQIEKAGMARRIGIVASALGRQASPAVTQVVTEQIKRAAPHVSVEVVNIAEITSDALDKVPDIEAWVEVGCPRLAIDWGESFSKPILTPFEALSLFGTPCFPSSPPSSSESPAAEHLPIPPCGGSVMHYLPTDTLCPCAGSDVVHPMDQWRPATERPWLHSGAERALKLKADYSEHCAQNAPTLMNDAQAVKAPSSAVSIPAVIVAI